MSFRSHRSRRLFNFISSLAVIGLAAVYFAVFETPTAPPQDNVNEPPVPAPLPAPKNKQTPFEILQESPPAPDVPVEQTESDELPKDLQEQLAAPVTELPDDLKAQLEEPEPDLPDDLKAQLEAPPPELPEDIKRALAIPPRAVTMEEVNGNK